MANNTKQSADQSFFIAVRDTNTGKIKRIAIPSDVQIGMLGNPAELQLLGRLSLSTRDCTTTNDNQGIFSISSNDTIINVVLSFVPSTNTVALNLPAVPRDGELHFIKDSSGTASSTSIVIIPAPGVEIDGEDTKTISTSYGSLAIYWFNNSWHVLVSSSAAITSSDTSGSINASYVTLSSNSDLTNERILNLTGSNLVMSDGGAGGSLVLDLSNILGSGAGTFTYSTVTVDAFGRITAISSGPPPGAGSGADVSASYITVAVTGSLPNERALAIGTGLTLNDGGAGSNITLGINNNVVATISGSRFTGPVVATAGLSGSLQQLSSGISYIVAGQGILISSSSNGQILIQGPWVDAGSTLETTASVTIDSQGRTVGSIGSDVYFFVSGTIGVASSSASRRVAVFGGDVRVSGSITVGSGSVTLTSNDVQFGGFGTRIEKNGPDLKFFDQNNPTGLALTALHISGSADVSASYVTIGNTGSLPNERALTAGVGLSLVDGGAGSTVTLGINNNVVATVSGTTFTGVVSASAGLSGSLQQVGPGLPYLLSQGSITITTQSNGQIIISGSGAGAGSSSGGADVSASYIVVGNTGSLPNERALVAGSGISIVDGGAGGSVTISATGGGNSTTGGAAVVVTGSVWSVTHSMATQLSASGTPSMGGAAVENDGTSFFVLSTQKVIGARLWFSSSTTRPLEVYLWGPSSNRIVREKTSIGPGEGLFFIPFTTATYTIAADAKARSELGATFIVSVNMIDSGTRPRITSATTPSLPYMATPDYGIISNRRFGSGDSIPNASAGTEWYPVEPVFQDKQTFLTGTGPTNSSGSTWITAFDIDFTTQASASFTTNGEHDLAGYTWTFQNMINADAIGIQPTVGLIIDPNANSSDFFQTAFTAPAISLPITRSIPNFNLRDYELRLWIQCEVTGADANFEIAKSCFVKYPLVTGGTKYALSVNKGFSTSSFTNAEAIVNSVDNSGELLSVTNNYFMMHWRDILSVAFHAASGSSPTLTFDQISGSLTLMGTYGPGSGITNASTHGISGSGDIAILLAGQTVNTNNSFQGTWRKLRLDYRHN